MTHYGALPEEARGVVLGRLLGRFGAQRPPGDVGGSGRPGPQVPYGQLTAAVRHALVATSGSVLTLDELLARVTVEGLPTTRKTLRTLLYRLQDQGLARKAGVAAWRAVGPPVSDLAGAA